MSPKLSIQETAEVLGVSTQTISRWIVKGWLRAYRYGPDGRTIRIDPDDVDKARKPVSPLAASRGRGTR